MRLRDLIPAVLVVCIALTAGRNDDPTPLPSDGPQFRAWLDEQQEGTDHETTLLGQSFGSEPRPVHRPVRS